MPNIIVNGKTFTFDKIIYADGVNGLDTNDGLTENTPVKTLTKANSLSTNSNTSCIYLLGGEFTVSKFTLNGCLIGKAGKFPIINYDVISGSFATGVIFNTPDIIVTGVIFKANGTTFINNYHFSTSTGTTIANCVFYNYIQPYKWFVYTNQITIKNCYFGEGYTPAVLNAYSGGFTLIDNFFKTESDVDEIYYPINSEYQNKGVYSGELAWVLIKFAYILNKKYANSKNDILNLTLLSQKLVGGVTPDYASFKVKLNDSIIHAATISSSFPQTINIPLTNAIFTSINKLSVTMNNLLSLSDTLYYEGDGLLNPINRDFKSVDGYTKSDLSLVPAAGYSLVPTKNTGSVFTDISVYRKSEVKKVTIDGDNDKVITNNFKFKPNYIEDFFFKNVITRPFGSRFTSMIYKDFRDALYMKAPVEFPGNFNLTDGNETTTYISVGKTATVFTFNLDKLYDIISARVYSTSGYTDSDNYTVFKYYDINDNLLYQNTVSTLGNITTQKYIKNVSKVTVTASSYYGRAIYTLALLGFASDFYNLYSNTKYITYSKFGYSVSKFILEDNTTPITKDLVKSKKMGNLAFINNSAKATIKKYSYSKQEASSTIVRNKIDLKNLPIRRIEVK